MCTSISGITCTYRHMYTNINAWLYSLTVQNLLWTCDCQNMPYSAMGNGSDSAIKQAQVIIETYNL